MDMKEEKQGVYTPLLATSSGHEEEDKSRLHCCVGEDVAHETRKQLSLAGPMVAAYLLQRCIQMSSVMFVGHLGKLQLAGASMATSFITVTGFSVGLGLSAALDTLCGQAFGAKQYNMLGVYFQRSIFVLSFVSIPLAILWAYTENILLAFGQDPDISKEAGTYAIWMIPALFAFGILQSEARFLSSQNNVLPMMLTTGLCAIFHIFLCWSLVIKFGFGYWGAALANSISFWINAILLALYIKISPACSKTWTGLSRRAFRDISGFLKLAAPSAVMTCFEWWSLEILVLLAGILPNPKLETSVLAIILNTSSAAYTIPHALAGAVSTRVANELGAGSHGTAKTAVHAMLLLVSFEAVVVSLAIIFIRHIWGHLFSNDTEVIEYVSSIMPLLAVTTFMDSIQCGLTGIARGAGWQKLGAVVNLGAFYVFGLPLSVVLGFVFHYGGKGLWFGVTCAIFIQMLLFLIITVRTNWEEEAKKAQDRVYSSALRTDGDM